ncbi:hypothetical protein Dvina_01700 [Dactylosporangium vinaceum]|nr:hypothetical protein Dvina_01700 [Dactylosporangium vinaceum]
MATAGAAALPATNLYAGEHWQIAKTLAHLLPSRTTHLWVCSAGYGLIRISANIQPYAATFALGMADSVGEDRASTRDWWRRLTAWPGPEPGQPRSIADLSRRDPDSTIIAVLSDAYQRACAPDIVDAANHLRDTQQLSVLGPSNADLGDLVVPVSARLQATFGGSLLSLNVRAAAYLLRSSSLGSAGLNRSEMQDRLQHATDAVSAAPSRPAGRRLTDEQVRAFIRSHLADELGTATGLLRRLRKTGQSCEQARFGQLFAEVTASVGSA